MFEQALMLVPVGVVVGLAARSVCRAEGRGSSPGWMACRWTWPAVAVTVLGLLALGPREFASATVSVACLVGLPLVFTNGWLGSSAASPQTTRSRGLAFGSTPATPSNQTYEVFETSEVSDDAEPITQADDAVTHWLKRSRPSASEERIEGMTRAEFAAGQKQVAVHVAFCPPLPVVPVVTCELLGDADVRLRVTAAQTYGLRIEARRSSEIDDALAVAVQFVAMTDVASTMRQPSRSAA